MRLKSPYLYHKKKKKERKKKNQKAFTQILQWEVGVVGGWVRVGIEKHGGKSKQQDTTVNGKTAREEAH